MGILNVTPDSFSDGGKYADRRRAVERAVAMAGEGAGIIDVGGESTRPGARAVSEAEETARVIPVIAAISKRVRIPISVDTRKAKVAEAAIRAGASVVNDVSGLKYDPAMAKVAAGYGAGVVVMHMKGTPADMQRSPRYGDLIREIKAALRDSIRIARAAGIDGNKIIIDPGIGFGKTVKHNLEILNRLDEFKDLGKPVCVGTSRKAFIGAVLDLPAEGDRLAGTIATCVIAIMNGADILRVHDVKEAAQAAAITGRILKTRD
ncbi:MAG: dihydropteroate synthase [Candidatus Omnitrophica bacterium]|nr:dihydropteroate synthase [Candidatus Omnitrophota bacterium]MDD5436053.1 dihydropteroate synthase [Candidatus Omnitrophota bacterium]